MTPEAGGEFAARLDAIESRLEAISAQIDALSAQLAAVTDSADLSEEGSPEGGS
jgi:prefoldin subunit 5